MKEKRQSVVKTIRLPGDLDQYLAEEARRSNQTTAAFITFIILSYRNRFQLVEKLNPLAIRPSSLALFINEIEDKRLAEIGVALSTDVLPTLSLMIAPVGNSDWLEWCISEFLPSINWYNCIKSSKGCMITHTMGRKWTVLLQSFLGSLIFKYPGEKLTMETNGENILIKSKKNNLTSPLLA